ncbi:hypothetical protein QQF64_007227 [Cirrhinus molitorella]|uniref:Uncharacterized protein n=1 Tax=Cirrhinus molitorella TaxID=172907 RepID=A0ABR3MA32_9TELE
MHGPISVPASPPKAIPSTLSRAFSLPQSLSLFRYLCKNFQSTLFTLLCHPCHLCFTCWGGEKFLDETLFAAFSKATAFCWFSLCLPLQLSSKQRTNTSFPSNIPYFTIQKG